MPDVASLARAAKAIGLPLAACRLAIEAGDWTASPGSVRKACRDALEGIARTVADPSGWIWGDTGIVRVSRQADLCDYDGILFSAEIGSDAVSVHLRALADGTWRTTTYREVPDGAPTHLAESVTLLGASLRDLPELAKAHARYRRYWQAFPDDRSRPVAARLIELR